MKLEKKEVYTRKEVCEMLVAMQVETLKCNGFFAGHVAQTWAVDCMIGKRIEALGELGVRKECDANTGAVKYMWEPSSDERNEKENPNRYDDLYIFIPDENQIIRISEGSGDNLLPEDTAEGYVDYIYYEQYELGNGLSEVDGGQVLLEEMFRDKFRCTEEAVGDVLSMAYGTYEIDYVVLKGKENENH